MPSFASALEAADWIQGKRYAGAKNGLQNMRALLDELDHPERGLTCVHVAGTNGKGSVCAMTERALRACGKKTGLYTSPYLVKYNDRMRIDGVPMPDGALIRLAERVAGAAEALTARGVFPTAFELGTAIALMYFAEERVDFAIMEVGLGGRLDATNVISPAVCAIAAIGLDHTALLGDTLPAIAAEKAGIVKPGVPCVAIRQDEAVMDVFRETCARLGSPFTAVERPDVLWADAHGALLDLGDQRLEIHLPGDHQADNAALSFAILSELRRQGHDLPMSGVLEGFRQARWPARLTWVGRALIDGAHNPQGAEALVQYVNKYFAATPKVLVTAMMQDKAISECARTFAGAFDRVICTQIDYARSASAAAMRAAFAEAGREAQAIESIPEAIDEALRRAGDDGIAVIAGSLYLAGDAILHLSPELGDAL